MEAERGLESTDNHLCLGEATIPLVAGQWRGIAASLEAEPPADLLAALHRRLDPDRLAVSTAIASSAAMRHTPPWIARLALAADAFVFSRPLASVPDGQSVIAGYPSFGDWGRDTMISLPGLTLATGRPDVACRILETFARFVSEGMLPNVFPGAGDHPEYNADASLWFFEACCSASPTKKAITARTSRSCTIISMPSPATPMRACSASCRRRPIPING
jgi:4-alpha-glucanotransferase